MAGIYGERYIRDGAGSLVDFIKDDLPYLDLETPAAFYETIVGHDKVQNQDVALLGCNDRFFLLTYVLNRTDAIHTWIFNRCREIEADPDGHLDLWAR